MAKALASQFSRTLKNQEFWFDREAPIASPARMATFTANLSPFELPITQLSEILIHSKYMCWHYLEEAIGSV